MIHEIKNYNSMSFHTVARALDAALDVQFTDF